MNYFRKKFLEKQGNNFIIGLLIVFAGIGIGTIILTYRDYHTNKTMENTTIYIQDSMNDSTPVILENLNKQDQEFNLLVIQGAGKNIKNNMLSIGSNFKTSVDFIGVAKVTIVEEYMDEKDSIYLCNINVNDNEQLVRIIINDENYFSMCVVNDNGEVVDDKVSMPLSVREYIVSIVRQLYTLRRG